MIDNYSKALALVEKMKEQFPIPARPTKELMQTIQGHKFQFTPNQELQINTALYMGDEGGICCGIAMPEDTKEALVTSITHLRIPANHPLAAEIRAYQKKRIKKLARLNR